MTQGTIGVGPGTEHTGNVEDRVTRLENWINFLANYTAYSIIPGIQHVSGTSDAAVGGASIPWGTLRRLLQFPDARWDVWAAGLVQNATQGVTITLVYVDNAGTSHALATAAYPAHVAAVKYQIGPSPLRGPFATAIGIPQNEEIWSFGMNARMTTPGGSADLAAWTFWIRQSPTRS